MRKLAEICAALADPTRLEMLALLSRRDELCVCDFVAILGITQSKASRHLRYLRAAGLLSDRRDGAWVHYRIATDLDPAGAALLAGLRAALAARDLTTLDARVEQWMTRKATGGPTCTATDTPADTPAEEARA